MGERVNDFGKWKRLLGLAGSMLAASPAHSGKNPTIDIPLKPQYEQSASDLDWNTLRVLDEKDVKGLYVQFGTLYRDIEARWNAARKWFDEDFRSLNSSRYKEQLLERRAELVRGDKGRQMPQGVLVAEIVGITDEYGRCIEAGFTEGKPGSYEKLLSDTDYRRRVRELVIRTHKFFGLHTASPQGKQEMIDAFYRAVLEREIAKIVGGAPKTAPLEEEK